NTRRRAQIQATSGSSGCAREASAALPRPNNARAAVAARAGRQRLQRLAGGAGSDRACRASCGRQVGAICELLCPGVRGELPLRRRARRESCGRQGGAILELQRPTRWVRCSSSCHRDGERYGSSTCQGRPVAHLAPVVAESTSLPSSTSRLISHAGTTGSIQLGAVAEDFPRSWQWWGNPSLERHGRRSAQAHRPRFKSTTACVELQLLHHVMRSCGVRYYGIESIRSSFPDVSSSSFACGWQASRGRGAYKRCVFLVGMLCQRCWQSIQIFKCAGTSK
ncbi:unnamed protein product, partial [Urochloa humidicola]